MNWIAYGPPVAVAVIAWMASAWVARRAGPSSTLDLTTASTAFSAQLLADNVGLRDQIKALGERYDRDMAAIKMELATLTAHVITIEHELEAERKDVAEYARLHGPLRRRSTDTPPPPPGHRPRIEE